MPFDPLASAVNEYPVGSVEYDVQKSCFTFDWNQAGEQFYLDVKEIMTGIMKVMVSKQRDYGPHNIAKFGEAGVVVRMSDKMERLCTLLTSDGEANNESVDDTLIDLANYCVIALMVRRGKWPAPTVHKIGGCK